MIEKKCTKCGARKPIEMFNIAKETKSGYTCWCKDCKKVSDKGHRKRNKDSLDEKKRIYYANNKEFILDRNRQYREKNKESINTKKKASNKERNQLWMEWLPTVVELKCSACGYDKCFASLDFHHLRDKKFHISTRRKHAFNEKNRQILLDELEKCTILCANCHRELHHGS